jgi:hypothetical protein
VARTVTTWCPVCHEDSLEFDYGGRVTGPGITPYPEICDLLVQECACELTEEQVETARTHIVENPDFYFGRC